METPESPEKTQSIQIVRDFHTLNRSDDNLNISDPPKAVDNSEKVKDFFTAGRDKFANFMASSPKNFILGGLLLGVAAPVILVSIVPIGIGLLGYMAGSYIHNKIKESQIPKSQSNEESIDNGILSQVNLEEVKKEDKRHIESSSGDAHSIEDDFQPPVGSRFAIREEQVSLTKTDSDKVLLRWTFQDIFARCEPPPERKEIVVSGYVLGDGMGDYFHIMHAAKELKKQFPDSNIRIIILAADEHKDKLPIPNPDQFESHIAYSYGQHKENFDEEVLEKIKNADMLIDIPIQISSDRFDAARATLGHDKVLQFTEYDMDSVGPTRRGDYLVVQPGLGTRFLSPSEGVFTSNLKMDASLADLKHENLKMVLFGKTDPNQEDIEAYNETHQLNFGYLKRPLPFIENVLLFYEGEKNLDICTPFSYRDWEQLDNESKERFKNTMEERGIGKINFISRNSETGEIEEKIVHLNEESTGNELRMINLFPIPHKDVKRLACFSHALFGCTGDHSLAEALSFGKIPFYQFPGHKYVVQRSLTELTQHVPGGDQEELTKYLKNPYDAPKELGPKDLPKMEMQAKRLGQYVKDQYDFSSGLYGLVNWKFYCEKHPDLKALERELSAEYEKGNIDVPEVRERMINKMSELGIPFRE